MFGRLEDKMRKIGDASFSGMRRGENCLRGLLRAQNISYVATDLTSGF